MNKCSKCGFENNEGIKFCGECGENLVAEQISEQEEKRVTPEVKDKKKPNKIRNYVIIGASCAALIILVLFVNLNGTVKKMKTGYAKNDKEAVEVFYEKADSEELKKVEDYFLSEIERVTTDFKNNKITYEESNK